MNYKKKTSFLESKAKKGRRAEEKDWLPTYRYIYSVLVTCYCSLEIQAAVRGQFWKFPLSRQP
jgi:hypothetical protein